MQYTHIVTYKYDSRSEWKFGPRALHVPGDYCYENNVVEASEWTLERFRADTNYIVTTIVPEYLQVDEEF